MRNKIQGTKSMEKVNSRDAIRAARVKRTAEICGVSERLVNYVLDCERENEEVIAVFMELSERENLMVKAVKELIPFN